MAGGFHVKHPSDRQPETHVSSRLPGASGVCRQSVPWRSLPCDVACSAGGKSALTEAGRSAASSVKHAGRSVVTTRFGHPVSLPARDCDSSTNHRSHRGGSPRTRQPGAQPGARQQVSTMMHPAGAVASGRSAMAARPVLRSRGRASSGDEAPSRRWCSRSREPRVVPGVADSTAAAPGSGPLRWARGNRWRPNSGGAGLVGYDGWPTRRA